MKSIKNWIDPFFFFPNPELKNNPSSINILYEDVYVENNFENTLNDVYHGWFIKGDNNSLITRDKCILFLHGNAGNISNRLHYIESFYNMGFSLLFFDYPGFGKSNGKPSEESCIQCSSLFYDYLFVHKNITKDNIILYGESIGGSIASSLALLCNSKYLVIQSSFTEIKDISLFFKLDFGFNTMEYLKKRYKLNRKDKKMKTMIIHSKEDEIIDIQNAEKLALYADNLYITTGTHSNINIDNNFIYELFSFLQS